MSVKVCQLRHFKASPKASLKQLSNTAMYSDESPPCLTNQYLIELFS